MGTLAARPLPKWIMQRYSQLWNKYKDRSLEHDEISKILGEKHASIILCYLKKNGWVEVALNPDDTRKRNYVLKSPEKAVEEMAK